MCKVEKKFDILAISLNNLHNYSNSPIKLFSDLYLATFLYLYQNLMSIIKFFFMFKKFSIETPWSLDHITYNN